MNTPSHEKLPVESAIREIGAWTGLAFRDADQEGVASAVRRAMDAAGLDDLAGISRLIEHDTPARDALVAELTVGETYFFRERGQLDFIRQSVLPAILRHRPDSPIRVWSAGCASGEEAYTLAILLREAGLHSGARIIGTDIARARLAHARRARYGRWSLRGMAPDALQRYFLRRGSKFELVPEIRDAVEFRHLNLAGGGYPSVASGVWGMDLILCRNVLIYLDNDTVAHVARGLLDSLSDGGWLMLGGADPLLGGFVSCEAVVTGEGIAYRRKRPRSIHPAVPAAPSPQPAAPSPSVPAVASSSDAVASNPATSGAPSDTSANRVPRPAVAPAEGPGNSVEVALALVRSHADAGRLDDAGRACAAGLERFPDCAELVYLHSVLLAQGGRHRDAAAAARRAVYLDRKLIVAHLGLGCALVRLSDIEGARRAFLNAKHLLDVMPPLATVPASGGEPAIRLAGIARAQLQLLGEVA